MSSNAPVGAASEPSSTGDSVKQWIASFLRYLELRLRLLLLESKEAGLHLLVVGILVTSVLVLFAGSLVMLAVFLLYLVVLLTHWAWGWAALLCAGILLAGSITAAIILRFRITRRLFPMTLEELQKDREWLKSTTRNAE
ncbi:MAG: phage holin family protein [Verrucomicrobia bacterium]|nr:phage holin family protein [Verrucomicrobiota bacterium]MBV9274528.1 phage holin family protein [Verrucomicrobiota bacterium]